MRLYAEAPDSRCSARRSAVVADARDLFGERPALEGTRRVIVPADRPKAIVALVDDRIKRLSVFLFAATPLI
jgi:hypothetical protein